MEHAQGQVTTAPSAAVPAPSSRRPTPHVDIDIDRYSSGGVERLYGTVEEENPSTLSFLPSHYYFLPDDRLTLTLLFDLTVV
jgi:hypothetical protein